MSTRPTPQQHLASDPETSVWVSASAGTGKTRVLVHRLLRLMLRNHRPEKLLCITFTKMAAAEILERLQETASDWAIIPDDKLIEELDLVLGQKPTAEEKRIARRLLPAILRAPGGIRIMTIHAFCQSILARFPLEAGVTPGFRVSSEAQSRELLQAAKQSLMESVDQGVLYDTLLYLLDRISEDTENTLVQKVLTKRNRLDKLFAKHGDLVKYEQFLRGQLGVPAGMTMTNLADEFAKMIPRDALRAILPVMQASTSSGTKERAAQLAVFLADGGTADEYADFFLTKEKIIHVHYKAGLKDATAVALLEAEAARITDYISRKHALMLVQDTMAMLRVCRAIQKDYELTKKQSGMVDYEDQILLTARLLTELSDSAWILYKLDNGLDHILIDEAQDTSPPQWNVVVPLIREFFQSQDRNDERTAFIVGDEKQSIFSFQNADPVAFAATRHELAIDAAQTSHPWQDIALTDNFRSAPLILQLTDTVFAEPNLKAAITQDNRAIQHSPSQANSTAHGMIELWPLVPKPDKEKRDPPVSEVVLAGAIATHVKKTLEESHGGLLPGDIMILVRTRGKLVGALTKAFKDRNLAVSSADQILLNEQLVVQDCLAALQVALNPFDDYALACLLKSPFIGISEEQLFSLSHGRTEPLIERVTDRNVLGYLQRLSAVAARGSLNDFIQLLLSSPCPGHSRSGRYALVERLGFDSDEILDQLIEAGRNFESDHIPSCQNFLVWMQQNDSTVKRQSGSGDPTRIQIMTVHSAKGLQAKIVYMADANTKPSGYRSDNDILWQDDEADGFLWGVGDAGKATAFDRLKQAYVDRQFSEYYRLLYVALTRPQNRLIVCGWEPGQNAQRDYQSWYQIVQRAFGQLQGQKDYVQSETTLFSASLLRLEQNIDNQTAKNKQKKVINRPEMPSRLISAPPAEPKRLRPLRPSRPPGMEQPSFSPLQEKTGASFTRGTLLHGIFRVLPDYPADEQADILRRMLDRDLSLSEKQKAEIFDEVMAIMTHKDFQFLFTPQARAEVPLIGEVSLNGTDYAINGQVDRLVVLSDRVIIVDYKTNRPPPLDPENVPEMYVFQMRAYKALLQRIYPDRKIETALLWTAVPYLLPLSV